MAVQISGVLFDVDDTLFDYSSSEEAGLLGHLRDQALLERFPDEAAAVALWRSIGVVHYGRFLNGELNWAGQQRERTREFLARLGRQDVSDELAVAWFAAYEVRRNAAWGPFPDAVPVVKALAPGYRLGIVSNSSAAHQRKKLDAFGLLPFFENALICSDEHGASKPAPSIFLAGCAALGLTPSEVAYVGDNYAADAEGASAAGLHAYWLDRGQAGDRPEVGHGIQVIRSLDEFPGALARTAA